MQVLGEVQGLGRVQELDSTQELVGHATSDVGWW